MDPKCLLTSTDLQTRRAELFVTCA